MPEYVAYLYPAFKASKTDGFVVKFWYTPKPSSGIAWPAEIQFTDGVDDVSDGFYTPEAKRTVLSRARGISKYYAE